MTPIVKYKKLDARAVVPQYATPGAAAADLCAVLDTPLTLAPMQRALVPTGLAIELPGPACVALVYARSGLSIKYGLCMANGVGVIDSDYRGELRVPMVNLSNEPYTIQPGERVAQLCIAPVWQAEAQDAREVAPQRRRERTFRQCPFPKISAHTLFRQTLHTPTFYNRPERKHTMALILASGSPRRRELMSLITPDYTVITSDVDETKIAADSPAHLAKALATAKARAVAEENPDDVVCGFDTVVECEGEVFGKPKDEADAVRMLRALSGREHRVHTGVCICRGRRAAATVETTVVHFSPIAEDDLCAYVRTPEPYDKAGAYAIQGHAALWCAGIEGCYYNIMGLPVHRTAQLLREFT